VGGFQTLMVGGLPTVDYHKLLAVETAPPPSTMYRKVLPSTPCEIANPTDDYGLLARSRLLEVADTIHYVYDRRHSHDLETIDTTTYNTTNTSWTAVLSIDYGSVISAKLLYVRMGLYTAGALAHGKVECSVNGTAWTTLFFHSTGQTSLVEYIDEARNISFQYLRLSLYTSDAAYRAYGQLRKVVIIK